MPDNLKSFPKPKKQSRKRNPLQQIKLQRNRLRELYLLGDDPKCNDRDRVDELLLITAVQNDLLYQLIKFQLGESDKPDIPRKRGPAKLLSFPSLPNMAS